MEAVIVASRDRGFERMPVPALLIGAGADACRLLIRLVPVSEHDLVASLAQPRLVAAQTGDYRADVRNETAAEPEHIRAAGILLLHRSLGDRRSAADREQDQRSTHYPD